MYTVAYAKTFENIYHHWQCLREAEYGAGGNGAEPSTGSGTPRDSQSHTTHLHSSHPMQSFKTPRPMLSAWAVLQGFRSSILFKTTPVLLLLSWRNSRVMVREMSWGSQLLLESLLKLKAIPCSSYSDPLCPGNLGHIVYTSALAHRNLAAPQTVPTILKVHLNKENS